MKGIERERERERERKRGKGSGIIPLIVSLSLSVSLLGSNDAQFCNPFLNFTIIKLHSTAEQMPALILSRVDASSLRLNWGRWYDHKFLQFLTIFGENIGVFSKTNIMIQIYTI
jgi:hypothetical protein